MSVYREVIEAIFSLSLFINAVSFIPQILRIIREKSVEGISLITFSIFLGSQLAAVLYGLLIHNNILIMGYALSMLTCAPVIVLILFYRRQKSELNENETNIDGISFKDILEKIPAHIYWKDFKGRCLGASDLQCASLGFTRKQLLGKSAYDYFPRDQAEKIIALDQEVLTKNLSIVCEEIGDEVNAKERLYLSHKTALKNKRGKIVALLGVSIDITDARRQEIERKNLLETIIALMPGHVYWMDRQGVYQGCNDIQAKSAGLNSRLDIIGKRNQDLPWNMNSVVSDVIDKANEDMMQSDTARVLEEPVAYIDGKKGYCLSSKVPLHDSTGKVVGLLGISIDITEKKKAEEELLKAKEAAEAANDAKTEFLANMSHDVKTPLSGVVGMADLIVHDSDEKSRLRAQAIYACGMQLLDFFNSCLELSQLEMTNWSEEESVFSPSTLLHEMEVLFSPAAQVKGLQFQVLIEKDLPSTIIGYRDSIYRVLLNLIGNALKFTEKGFIQVRGYVSDRLSPTQVLLGFEVKDTGIGIPEDKHQVIFEKMKRLTPAYEGKVEGSGIGLYIVDQYVKRMKGQVRVNSILGQGATFTVLLPVMLMSAEQKNSSVLVASEPPVSASIITNLKTSSILLVEDNALIQHVTQLLLEEFGLMVDVAENAATAIQKFSSKHYDLVYLDLGLPDQDGYAVARAFRAHEAALHVDAIVPIIALTAHAARDVEEKCLRTGMQAVISKPLTREQVKRVWEEFGSKVQDKHMTRVLPVAQQTSVNVVETPILDWQGTIHLLGSESYAKELLVLWYDMLIHRFLPALRDLVAKREFDILGQELHAMLGSLCYIKSPCLYQAVLELQEAVRNRSESIKEAHEKLQIEAQRFIEYYQKNFL